MPNVQLRNTLLLMGASFIWGTAFVAQSVGADHMGPYSFLAGRSWLACVFLLGLMAVLRKAGKTNSAAEPGFWQNRKVLVKGGICCGIALALACNLQQLGMVAGASAGKTSFITTLYVVLVPICGLFLKKKVSPTVWISVLLAVAGLYCLCIKENFTIAPSDLLVMLCAFGYTLHILVIDYFTQRVDGVKMSCIQFLTCAILSAILMLIFENPTWADIVPCMGSVLYVGVFSSGVAYTLQILAQKDSNPTIVALLLSLESVFGAVSGAIFLHETMTGKELIGCVLMLIAVVLAQLDLPLKKRDKSAKEA